MKRLTILMIIARALAGLLAGLLLAAPAAAQTWDDNYEISTKGKVAAKTGVPVSELDPSQRATLSRVNSYFNSIQVLTANFVQTGPDGQRSTGKLFIDKPGKVRFQYNAPSPLEIVADGASVAVRDRKLATQDLWPLKQTPLRFLLAEKIDLLRDTDVIGVYQEPELVSVVLEEKNAIGGKAQLQLTFGGSDYQLREWTITDAQGLETSVAISNLDTASRPDPKLFRINQQRMLR